MRSFTGTELSMRPSASRVLSYHTGYFDHSESSDSGLFLVNSRDGLKAIIMLRVDIESPRKKCMFEAVPNVGVKNGYVNFAPPRSLLPGSGG